MESKIKKEQRLYFIDLMRVTLTILVVIHHIAVTYGPIGSWFYYERTDTMLSNISLTMFVSINQSFFMGLFFMISGYFTPASYERKGFIKFLKDRFLRLGIPLIFYTITIGPILEYFKLIYENEKIYSFWHYYNYAILHFKNIAPGPLWFTQVLLIFSIIYAVIRKLSKNISTKHNNDKPKNTHVIILIITMTLITFIVRIWYPTGKELFHLQLAYFTQYICMYYIGILAYEKEWIYKLSEIPYKFCLRIVIALVLLWPIIVISSGVLKENNITLFMGGLNYQAFVLALWENAMCVYMSLSLFLLFYRKYNYKSKLGDWLATNAYTVYIIHAPIIVFIALNLSCIEVYPLIKFIIVSIVGVPVCFLLSSYIAKTPYIKNIL